MGLVNADYSDDDKESLWQRMKQKLKRAERKDDAEPKDDKQPQKQRSPPDAPKYPVGTLVRFFDWTLCTVDSVRKNGAHWEYQLSLADPSADPKGFEGQKWQEEDKVYRHDEENG